MYLMWFTVRIITPPPSKTKIFHGTDLASMRSCCWVYEVPLWAWNSLLRMEGLQGHWNRSDLWRRRKQHLVQKWHSGQLGLRVVMGLLHADVCVCCGDKWERTSICWLNHIRVYEPCTLKADMNVLWSGRIQTTSKVRTGEPVVSACYSV